MQKSTNTMAIASLVLGIVALLTLITSGIFYLCLPLPLIFGVLAWVFGKSAISQIDAGLGDAADRGMAVAGYVMGIIATILSIVGLCCAGGVLAGILGAGLYPLWDLQRWAP
ncbi:MAG: hypothetical protein NZ874_06360 [Fimbriimonadales bacterium]|nr:hypothetical protein [Fimbriimonadales bacterium]